jgi:hypothetical protein
MSHDKTQRARMAADLCERAGIAFRGRVSTNGAATATSVASFIHDDDYPEHHYRRALRALDVAPEAIDAAVAAIREHRHPADSLPGLVEKMRDDATCDQHDALFKRPRPIEAARAEGHEKAIDAVLDLLGCAPAGDAK